jgi:HK97 family phage prohead protease
MTDIFEPAGGSGLRPARNRVVLDDIERRYGKFGDREIRQFPVVVEETREPGETTGGHHYTIRGHAAVFARHSLDLGGFKEKVARGAFDKVLERNPDAWLLWDHDTRYVLARTTNKTLELRIDPMGLHYWAKVAPTSYAADLRVLMDRGDIDQASFAFTVSKDNWEVLEDEDTGEERVERTILEVGELYDVTVTAMGAYPQTDSQVVGERARDYAMQEGRLESGADISVEPSEPVGVIEEESHGDQSVGSEPDAPEINDLRAATRSAVLAMKERQLLAMKELTK